METPFETKKQKQELEPREPVAYPRYPKRIAGARRPLWEVVELGAARGLPERAVEDDKQTAGE